MHQKFTSIHSSLQCSNANAHSITMLHYGGSGTFFSSNEWFEIPILSNYGSSSKRARESLFDDIELYVKISCLRIYLTVIHSLCMYEIFDCTKKYQIANVQISKFNATRISNLCCQLSNESCHRY